MELLTAAQMRDIESRAMASGAVEGGELMERAGRSVVGAALDWRPDLAATAHRAILLCGPGNNGGDGYVIARLLAQRGWDVALFRLGDPAASRGDAAAARALWMETGGEAALSLAALREAAPADLVVDALFGTGLTRPVEGEVAYLLRWLDGAENGAVRARLLAVDAPSGLCLDSGRVLGAAAPAGLTVAFDSPKLGHLIADGPAFCGALAVRDIGLRRWREKEGAGREPDPSACAPRKARAVLIARRAGVPDGRAALWPAPARDLAKRGGHKYDHGHVLVVAGGVGRGGAARLAARAALRTGAGLVTVAPPPAAIIENAARLDAVMLRPCRDGAALTGLLEDERVTAVVIGPGLGLGPEAREKVEAALAPGGAARARRIIVLDADGLTGFGAAPEDLFARIRAFCAGGAASVALTPHMGEFARLFPDIAARLAAPAARGPAFSRADAVREAAARAGCVVLLKGADSLVAGPDGCVFAAAAVHERACPWLATAGSGDVLAGIIAGLFARGLAAARAAALGAWLHQEAARAFGPGLIAEDLPEALPGVFRDLGL